MLLNLSSTVFVRFHGSSRRDVKRMDFTLPHVVSRELVIMFFCALPPVCVTHTSQPSIIHALATFTAAHARAPRLAQGQANLHRCQFISHPPPPPSSTPFRANGPNGAPTAIQRITACATITDDPRAWRWKTSGRLGEKTRRRGREGVKMMDRVREEWWKWHVERYRESRWQGRTDKRHRWHENVVSPHSDCQQPWCET